MRRRIAFFVLLSFVVIPLAVGEIRERVIHVGAAGFDFANSIVAREILVEAYDKIGYRAEFPVYPPTRMIASFKSGEVDAMLIAEASFSEMYPGVIRVGTVIWNDELVAFSKSPLTVKGWESLKPYRIGYISAMFIIENHLEPDYKTFPVGNPVQLFKMLDADRTDAVVTSRAVGDFMISTLGLSGISRTGETLEFVPNYHFVSKNYADVARRLSVVLEEMEKSGRIAEITDATLARLFPNGLR
jgi:ABC-type amino acid transport substrate-binding protein